MRSPKQLSKGEELLLGEAERAVLRAYSPYSSLRIGAALLTGGGNIFCGANVENASIGLSICAERVAALAAVCSGERDFVVMAVASPDVSSLVPCGACLQFLSEFSSELKFLFKQSSGKITASRIVELLPLRFSIK